MIWTYAVFRVFRRAFCLPKISKEKQSFLAEMDVYVYKIFCYGRTPVGRFHDVLSIAPLNEKRHSHSISRALETLIMSGDNLNTPLIRRWYIGQVIVAALAISALEIVLMARGEQSLEATHNCGCLTVTYQSTHFTTNRDGWAYSSSLSY